MAFVVSVLLGSLGPLFLWITGLLNSHYRFDHISTFGYESHGKEPVLNKELVNIDSSNNLGTTKLYQHTLTQRINDHLVDLYVGNILITSCCACFRHRKILSFQLLDELESYLIHWSIPGLSWCEFTNTM